MEFKLPYMLAMREQAPKMFNRLRRTGALDAHVQMKVKEAYKMYEEMTANEPKYDNGIAKNLTADREAEQMVMETLIEFPADDEETTTGLKL